MTPLRIAEIVSPGRWPRPAADHITLDYDGRHRRRITLTSDHGTVMLLDLPRAISIPHGAGLRLEDGRVIEVLAGREALLEIRAPGPGELLKLAWHIGNRHLTAQMVGDRILIRRDHVIAAMLTGLGAQVREIDAAFDPEGGLTATCTTGTITRTIIIMITTIMAIITTAMSTSLAALFAWFSPAFPTGGFAYSHGLETAVAEGLVATPADLADWIEGVMLHGAGWADAVLFAAAHRASSLGDRQGLDDVAELAAAMAPSRERRAETVGQGEAFALAIHAGWPDAAQHLPALGAPLPVVAGAASAQVEAPLQTALIAYLNGFSANLIAAGVRLSLCGQTGAARTLAAVCPTVVDLATRAARSSLDDLGGCAFGSDIAAMRHESLPARLFIS